MANEIIDFELERGRHGVLLGREDVLAEVEELLVGASRGWVLVKGGPGMGKSALLATWLSRHEEQGHLVPHHFLRRGVEDWDQPEVVKRNLAAQVEVLFPELKDPEARPISRLRELLQRVSEKVLVPRKERLVLVVDGLDEVEAGADDSNPLKRFLPPVLPPGVWMLCASRPTYPYLSWLEGLDGVRPIDLDDQRWEGSNTRVVREYWEQARKSPRFKPPLTYDFVDEVVRRAQGNVLYSVKLAEWLEGQPVENRRAELLPRGLEKFLDESWERIQRLPAESRRMVEEGLGVLAVAREALPRSILSEVAEWREAGDPDRFLKEARAFLLEEPGLSGREKAWRPFHEAFRSFILESKLGARRERELHLRLAQQLCQWPVMGAEERFCTSYVLRHGVTHWLKAEQWDKARGLYTDLVYLEKRCELAGVLSVEEALKAAATEAPEAERSAARDLQRAIQAGSHRLKLEPKRMASHLYNWLRCSGWTAERIETALRPIEALPALRLRHPVRGGGSERTFEGHRASVKGCAVTPDGRRVVSASWDGTLKVWDLQTGKELATLQGHGGPVRCCAVTPDGRHVVSASSDNTLKVWGTETGECLSTLYGFNEFTAVSAGAEIICAGDEAGNVWILETGTASVRPPVNGTGRHEPEAPTSAGGIKSMVPAKSSQASMDLGIVIALPEEFREFLALLAVTPSAERDPETGQLNYTFEHPGTRHRCVATLIGEMNPGPAALQTERLLTRWSPRTLVMLGIAAGIHSDVRVGDVVIASQVDNYLDSSKAQPGSTPEAFEFSLGGTVYQADFDFLTQVRNFEFAQPQAFARWHQACAQELTELVPKEKVRTALVKKKLVRDTPSMMDAHLASGPVVGAAQQFTEWLRRKRDRNLKALEMESAGLMAAAMRRVEPARTLIIRGISDYGDERKKQLDKVGEGALRRYAMRNATRLLLQLLETGVLPGLPKKQVGS